jgi:hypothetical protein
VSTPIRGARGSLFSKLSLALAHRADPRGWCMTMTAYFDESGTHGKDSPAVLVGGFGATVAQWNGCEKRLKKLFADHQIEKFHAKDLQHRKGDFKGWDRQTAARFNSRFLQIIDEQLSFAVAGIVSPADYKAYYRDKPFPRRARPDTIYGICFRTAFVRSTLDFKDKRQDWPLNIVMESGHKNSTDATRIFEEQKKNPRFDRMFGTITFATKKDCIFLALADSFAYTLFRSQAGTAVHPTNPDAVPVGESDPPYYVSRLKMSRTLLEKRGLSYLYKVCCASVTSPISKKEAS